MKRVLFAFLTAFLIACSPQQEARAATATAYFAGGCFWCVEADMAKIPGVADVVSGYAGGDLRNPTYENHAGHIEAVKVTYDPARISYRELIDRFFPLIDPTDAGGQFCDRGHSYTTAIWVKTEAERAAAVAAREAAAKKLKQGKMVTPIFRYSSFWPAEGYHQDFAKKKPLRYNVYRQGCRRDAKLKAVWGGR